jgi:hypothetical protein
MVVAMLMDSGRRQRSYCRTRDGDGGAAGLKAATAKVVLLD